MFRCQEVRQGASPWAGEPGATGDARLSGLTPAVPSQVTWLRALPQQVGCVDEAWLRSHVNGKDIAGHRLVMTVLGYVGSNKILLNGVFFHS